MRFWIRAVLAPRTCTLLRLFIGRGHLRIATIMIGHLSIEKSSKIIISYGQFSGISAFSIEKSKTKSGISIAIRIPLHIWCRSSTRRTCKIHHFSMQNSSFSTTQFLVFETQFLVFVFFEYTFSRFQYKIHNFAHPRSRGSIAAKHEVGVLITRPDHRAGTLLWPRLACTQIHCDFKYIVISREESSFSSEESSFSIVKSILFNQSFLINPF